MKGKEEGKRRKALVNLKVYDKGIHKLRKHNS